MTIQAQLPDRAPSRNSPRHDRPTDGMDSRLPFIVEPYDLLDHRTRERLIPEAGAPSGRYLFYSTDATNLASQGVAARLNLRLIGWIWTLSRTT